MIPRAAVKLLDEIRAGYPVITITDDLLKGLHKWLAVAGDVARMPRLVHAGPESYVRGGIDMRHWQDAAG